MDITSDVSTTQAKIIDAAIKVFSKKGYEGATTSEIALEAGVAEGTIFRNFGTKKGILKGILSSAVISLQRPQVMLSLAEVIKNRDARFLRSMIKEQLGLVEKQLPLLRLLFYEAQFHKEVQMIIIQEIARPILVFLSQAIENQKETEKLRDLDTDLMVVSLLSSLWGYIMWKQVIAEQGIVDDEEAIIQIVNIWLKGVEINSDNR